MVPVRQLNKFIQTNQSREPVILRPVPWPQFETLARRYFDFDKLVEVASQVTRNLNKIIDVNYYPVETARRSNMRHRPIGMGVQVDIHP